MRLLRLAPLVFIACSALSARGADDPRETERIRAHLYTAEQLARSHPTDHLDADRAARRERALEVLSAYRERGVFPKNKDFPRPTPYFVDAAGTRCAMAELIHATGDDGLVDAVASTRNNARVHELADEPALIAWLEANGLSVDEAAAIQPNYCTMRSSAFCVDAAPPIAVVEVRYTRSDELGAYYEQTRVLYGEPPSTDEYLFAHLSWPKMVLVHRAQEISAYAVRADAKVQLAFDAECDGAPKLSVEDALDAWLAKEDCIDRVETLDPRFAIASCFNSDFDICAPVVERPLPSISDDPATPDEPYEPLRPRPIDEAAEPQSCRSAGGEISVAMLGLGLWLSARSRRRA